MFISLDKRVVSLLKHRMKSRLSGEDRALLGARADSDQLLRSDSMAMLIGLVLQRGMPAERVWQIPLHLRAKMGHLDPARIAQMSVEAMTSALADLDVRPRYPAQAAKTVVALAEVVSNEFGGDASSIWRERAMRDVIATLESLPWVGPGIAHMAVQLLMDESGYEPYADELPGLDVKADVHVVRVFYRLGLADADTRDAAVHAARQYHPEFPGLLDWPAWDVGRRFCRPKSPLCEECPLLDVCDKREVRVTAPTDQVHVHFNAVAEAQPFGGTRGDHAFWKFLGQLLSVALTTAGPTGMPARFSGLSPHLPARPRRAREECLRVVADILRSRLGIVRDDTHGSSAEAVCLAAISKKLISRDMVDWLLQENLSDGTDEQEDVAEAVTMIVRIIAALDG